MLQLAFLEPAARLVPCRNRYAQAERYRVEAAGYRQMTWELLQGSHVLQPADWYHLQLRLTCRQPLQASRNNLIVSNNSPNEVFMGWIKRLPLARLLGNSKVLKNYL